MKIVDAQVHIWRQTVSPPTGKHRKVSLVSAEHMLKEMDEAGVDAALIHPPLSWDPSSQEMALEAARKYPRRFAVMGQFDPKNPANKALIPTWRNQPGMMGLRWALLQPKEQELLHEGALDWIWPEAAKAGLSIGMMGGIFLKEFVSIPWLHLDIAGPAFNEGKAHGYTPVGGTGVAMRSLISLFSSME